MKKAFFSLFMIGAGLMAFAQIETTDNTTIITTRNYQAYRPVVTVPVYVESYLLQDYPAATEIMWWEAGNFYHATFHNNGRYNHVYYDPMGTSFTVSLPVTQNLVPDDVILKAGTMYGPMIYDIAAVRYYNNSEIYHVRLLQNGQLVSEWIDADGNRITDPFRTADMEVDMSTNRLYPADAKEVKIKVEHADGTETKTKIENGEVKTKVDD